ncbi:Na+/H+ antiporter [Aquabacter sp. L1I39]|uniref:Na+/H+ antiporter n=1 Tax=Aquabacter sp. L1I39 TaxID=2820278 RepID=UPI001ADD36D4|nr:Na+/H+ antiporter [Aquabacter sp. L1I39]QTL02429.1 Na+/H+ antiporter [Aquabacter sp. L1I39]
MEPVTTVLVLILAVTISGTIVRISPIPLPLPLVQIVLGALVAAVANVGVELKPEVFFLLFLPPLLFLDGWRIPKDGLRRDRHTVLALALGLVVFTVLGVGLFVNLLIPAMPLPVAFALAAVLSPTDPVAVSAIAERVPFPRRLMQILEGEALFNDASGLVCMRFAVAAALTGAFSLVDAFGVFLWLALGGIVVGVGATIGITTAKNWISGHYGEEPGSQILISLLIPFGAYLMAERLGCSGILAAVSAGITMSHVEQSGRALARTRLQRAAVWDTISFAANGTIFVLLGEQLPRLVTSVALAEREAGRHGEFWLLLYVVAINAALFALRFVWVWVSLRYTMFRHASTRPPWQLVAATSLAGARGAVTLAGILTLPLALPDGSPFPTRDLAIFLAAGAIIFSLIAASIGLPLLLHGLTLPAEEKRQAREDRARRNAAEAAIRAVGRAQHDLGENRGEVDLYAEVGTRIMSQYRQRIERRTKSGDASDRNTAVGQIEQQLYLVGMRAERDELYRMARAHEIPDEMARRLVGEVDLLETRFTSL